jgi:RNA polymerase-binding transcription factor DksA
MPDTTDATRRAQLTEEREQLLVQLGHMGRAPRGEATSDPDSPERGGLAFDEGFADSGQVTAERGEVDALSTSLLDGLREVDDALAKFADGTYGKCESCGEQISEARLEAMPSARLCISCASQRR